MAQHILIVSRHENKFSRAQRALVGKIHGSRAIITFNPKRFTSCDELLEFHREMIKNYDFIYYTLPVKLKLFLKCSGYDFGVILAPKKTHKHIEVTIVHHIPKEEEEIVKVTKSIPRSRGAKSYRNIPVSVRKSA